MRKGIVMNIEEGFMTLLTPEGEFLRARRQDTPHQLGEEIYFYPFESQKSTWYKRINVSRKVKPIWMVSVLAAFLIFFGSLIPMYHDNKAYAYMSIDANPSIELGLNKKMQVVELTGFNKDGKKVVSSLHNWKKKDVSELTQTLFRKMKQDGYLTDNKSVIISTVLTEDPGKEAKEQLKENINEIKDNVKKQQLEVTIYNSTEKEREEARKQGITAGKYHENHVKPSEKNKHKSNHDQSGKNMENPVNSLKSSAPAAADEAEKQTNPNQSNGNANQTVGEYKSQMAPGQLKKADEDHFEKNYGQMKKKDENRVKQNPGQLKKSFSHKEKSNQKYNDKEKH
jgi:nitrogen regulatory protein PII-like uncharacterized protein